MGWILSKSSAFIDSLVVLLERSRSKRICSHHCFLLRDPACDDSRQNEGGCASDCACFLCLLQIAFSVGQVVAIVTLPLFLAARGRRLEMSPDTWTWTCCGQEKQKVDIRILSCSALLRRSIPSFPPHPGLLLETVREMK